MSINSINIKILIENKNSEDARVIHQSLSPDNLTTPPMQISSQCNNSNIEIKITNVHNIVTAVATVNDLFEAYKLSNEILLRLNKSL